MSYSYVLDTYASNLFDYGFAMIADCGVIRGSHCEELEPTMYDLAPLF